MTEQILISPTLIQTHSTNFSVALDLLFALKLA